MEMSQQLDSKKPIVPATRLNAANDNVWSSVFLPTPANILSDDILHANYNIPPFTSLRGDFSSDLAKYDIDKKPNYINTALKVYPPSNLQS